MAIWFPSFSPTLCCPLSLSLNSSHVYPTAPASLAPPISKVVHELSPQLSGGSRTSHTSGSVTPVPTEVSGGKEEEEEEDGALTQREDSDQDLPQLQHQKEKELVVNKKPHEELSRVDSSREVEPSLSISSDVDSTPCTVS